MDPILKKAAEFADGMLDLISWMGNRMESKKKLATPEDVIGQNAEVTIPIKKGQTGEIVVVFENTRLTYGARGSDSQQEFHKGETAIVDRVASSLVYVRKREDANGRKTSLAETTEKRTESASDSGSAGSTSTAKGGSSTNGGSSSSSASGGSTSSGSKKKSKQEKTELLDDKHSEGHS